MSMQLLVETILAAGLVTNLLVLFFLYRRSQSASAHKLNLCRAFLAIAPEAILIYDAEGAILEVNQKARVLLDLPESPEQLGTVHALAAQPISRRDEGPLQWNEATQDDPREVELTTTAGKKLTLLLEIIPLEAGRRICFCQDLTALRAAQQGLEESERRFSAYMDRIPALAVMHNLDGVVLYGNRFTEEFSQIEPLQGRNYWEVFPEVGRLELQRETARVVNGESPLIQRTLSAPNGEQRMFRIQLFPVMGIVDNAPTVVVGRIGVDITDLSRTETALRQSQEQLTLAMESARLFSWDWNIQTGKVFCDRHWETTFGYTREELPKDLEQNFRIVHPEDLPILKQQIQRHLTKKTRVFSAEFRIRDKAGNYHWVSSLGAAQAFDEDAEPLRMLGVGRDITEQREAQEEIDRQRNIIYHMNRTATMGELAASLAHELNQPLAAIMTNAQAARRFLHHSPPDLAEVGEALEDIIQDDHRAGETISRMRKLLQKGEIELTPLDLNHLIREVIEFLNSEIIARNVLIHQDLSPVPRRVLGDRVQLQQVLLNLMLNACESMAGSGHEPKVLMISSDARQPEKMTVSVRDTGTGIPADQLEEIFKLFHSNKSIGMGAGLAICRSIIKAHKGEIWAENNRDRGATIYFRLPTLAGGEESADDRRVGRGEPGINYP